MDVYTSRLIIFKAEYSTIIFTSFHVFGKGEDQKFYTKISVNDSDVIDWHFSTPEELRKSVSSTVVSCLEFAESKTVVKDRYVDYITIHIRNHRLKPIVVEVFKFGEIETIQDLILPLYEEDVVFYHNELTKNMSARVFTYEVDHKDT